MNKSKKAMYEQALMQEIEELQMDETQDAHDEQLMDNAEFPPNYGVPEAEQQFNKHAFLANSLALDRLEKVTYLSPSELGIPLFNMRFILSIESLARVNLGPLCEKYDVPNKIEAYFRQKVDDIAASGMSNEGFVQKLNVTQKMDMTRTRRRNLDNLKGGGGKTIQTNE